MLACLGSKNPTKTDLKGDSENLDFSPVDSASHSLAMHVCQPMLTRPFLLDAGKPRRSHVGTPKSKVTVPRPAALQDDDEEEAAMSPLQQALKKLRQMKISQDSAAGSRSSAARQEPPSTPLPTRFGPTALNIGSQHADDGSRPLTPGLRPQQPPAASMDELDARLSAVRESNHKALHSLKPTSLGRGGHAAGSAPPAAQGRHPSTAGDAPPAAQRGALGPSPPGQWVSNPLAEEGQPHGKPGIAPQAATALLRTPEQDSYRPQLTDSPGWQLQPGSASQTLMLHPLQSFASPNKITRISAHISACGGADVTGSQTSGRQMTHTPRQDATSSNQGRPWPHRESPSRIPQRPSQQGLSTRAETQQEPGCQSQSLRMNDSPSRIPLRPAQSEASGQAPSQQGSGLQSRIHDSPSKALQPASWHRVAADQAGLGFQSQQWHCDGSPSNSSSKVRLTLSQQPAVPIEAGRRRALGFQTQWCPSDDSPGSKIRLTSRLSLSIGSSTAESPQTPAGVGNSVPRAHAAASSSQDTAESIINRPSFAWPHSADQVTRR